MKLDLSTIFLVVLCVIPGLFAMRARHMVCPRSFEQQGATGELGELVALGVSTHGIIIIAACLLLWICGLLFHCSSVWYFRSLDALPIHTWESMHHLEFLLLTTIYVFCSFGVSHWLGIVYGSRRLSNPTTARVLLFHDSLIGKRLGVTGLLGERPIIYEALSPPPREEDGAPFVVFVEIELKSSLGFYTGQVSQFSILKDDEPHKPIYLAAAYFKANRDAEYVEVEADGVLVDLADAAVVRVRQVITEDD